jgi:hypothetical protein
MLVSEQLSTSAELTFIELLLYKTSQIHLFVRYIDQGRPNVSPVLRQTHPTS